MFPQNVWRKLVTWNKNRLFVNKVASKVDLSQCPLQPNESLKYVWLNLKPTQSIEDDCCDSELKVDDWLNIIDESAALGANSMVVSAGISLSDHPMVWAISNWAQSVHGMHVGLHVQKGSLTDEELSKLGELDKKLTCLVVDKSKSEALESLNMYGIPIITSYVSKEKTKEHCTESGLLACIHSDGILHKCGLIRREQKIPVGNALSRPILELVKDEQDIANTGNSNPMITSNCGACPTLVAQQLDSANDSV